VILDRRVRRAVQKKTRFGQRAHLGIWAISEYETLQALSAAGADVPRPIAHSSDAVLMDYIGDAGDPAPTLNRVDLDHQSAIELFQQLIANIELFVRCDRVHGDLSPYNVLYWQGGVKIIDFPQASDPRFNPNSRMLLERDLVNICNHFRKFGVEADPGRIVNRMWSSYKRARL